MRYWVYIIYNSQILTSVMALLLGITITLFTVYVFTRKWFENILIKLFYKTPNDDIWRNVFDFKNGSNLKVYPKGKDYYVIGQLKSLEEKGESSWIALTGFCKMDTETNSNYKSEPSYINNKNVSIVMRISDIEHMEVF